MDKNKPADKQGQAPSGKPNPSGPTEVDGSKMKPIDKGAPSGPGGGGKKS